MKVCKFGGSSLAFSERVRQAVAIVQADPKRRIVVVSAPGKRFSGDTKVTDLLIKAAHHVLGGGDAAAMLSEIVARYTEIARDFGLDTSLITEIARDLRERTTGDLSHEGRFLDTMKAAGEDNCAKLFAAALRSVGTPAEYIDPRDAGMLLSDRFGNAELLPESIPALAASLSGRAAVSVFPGFFGYTRQGAIATFPRGGSDITASILAAAVKAELYENFTDVDSVFATDPRIVSNTRPIRLLSFREMRELSYAGFDVLHEEAILPAVHAGVPICILNTANPSGPGTRIVLRHTETRGQVVGIAAARGFCTLFVSKYLMNREIGFGRRLMSIIEGEGLSYEHMPSGIDNISIILSEKGFSDDTVDRVMRRIREDLAVDDVAIERGLALIMLVGEGMRYSVGIAARATSALAAANINIEMINQGSSEISLMFGVKEQDMKRAVQALYTAFMSEPESGAVTSKGASS